jgi:hypothetical protein
MGPSQSGAQSAQASRDLQIRHPSLCRSLLSDQDRVEDGKPVEIIRIISARAADKKKWRRYEQEIRAARR